jgi:uncharacterized damage-inducible protein DinB
MNPTSEYLKQQYQLIQDSRKVLLDYCETISSDDFIRQNTSFGRGGSMRNLLVHIANTYQHWIANISLKKGIKFTDYETVQNVKDLMDLFNSVDHFMHEFIAKSDSENEIQYDLNGVESFAKPLKLFTHVVTHEFHHKGQVLSISRHLGYIPVDTDIVK